jgi:predicted secreted protein
MNQLGTKFFSLLVVAIMLISCSTKVIHQDQDGQVVMYSVGTKFEIQLKCPVNDEHLWELVNTNSMVVKLLEPPERKTAEQTNKTHHIYLFRFETITEGNALLKFNLVIPDSTSKKIIDDFEIMITSGRIG